MILTDNDIFYMTGGGMCYSVELTDRRLRHVYFGKRVEPEDDIAALGGVDMRELFTDGELAAVVVSRNGKKIAPDFLFEKFELIEKPLFEEMPVLRGGKTLKITMKDETAMLALDLYYTPYARGGIARRAVLTNIGTSVVQVSRLACDFEFVGRLKVGEYGSVKTAEPTDSVKVVGKFICAADESCSERTGDAYGLLLMYGGTAVARAECDETKTRIVLGFDLGGEELTVEPNGSIVAPEILAVYSDVGFGGMSRAFHDIIREHALSPNYFARRNPITLCCPDENLDAKITSKTIVAASELGADTFVVDGGEVYNGCADCKARYRRIAEACAEHGVKLGISLDPQSVVAHGKIYKEHTEYVLPSPRNADGYLLDFSREEAVEYAFSRLHAIIIEYGIEYIQWKSSAKLKSGVARHLNSLGMQKLYSRLRAALPDLVLENGTNLYSDNATDGFMNVGVCSARSAAYPLCAMRNILSIDSENHTAPLKTRFDAATLGCLGYELDPTTLGEDARRAIRAQVFSYQDDAATVTAGDLYRLGAVDGDYCLMAVAKDKSKAYAVFMSNGSEKTRIKFFGLDEHNLYHVRELNKTFSGAALAGYGIVVENPSGAHNAFTFHFGQVADYE